MNVFISHSHIDDPFVNKLVGLLEQHQVATFVDHRNISPGEHWPSKVQSALKSCAKMIAVLSDHSVASRNCTDEWDYFLDWKGSHPKEIIPLRLSGSDTYFRLSSFHYIDFAAQAEETAFAQLIGRLTDAKIEVHKPPPAPDQPDRPLSARLALRYPLARRPEKAVGIATGNIAELTGVDALVNSENNWLHMDAATRDSRAAQRSVSAAIHSFGARWSERGELLEDVIDNELAEALGNLGLKVPVPLATVLDTSAGSLEHIGIRRVLHVVSVNTAKGRRSARAGTLVQLGRCVANVLHYADRLNRERFGPQPLRRIVMPIFGTGRAGMPIETAAPVVIMRAVEHLEYDDTQLETVYFAAYRQAALDALQALLGALPDLGKPVAD